MTNITKADSDRLNEIAEKAATAMSEQGAHSVIILYSRQVNGVWGMQWRGAGSPYERLELARRYPVIDDQLSQAGAIGDAISDPPEGEDWKNQS